MTADAAGRPTTMKDADRLQAKLGAGRFLVTMEVNPPKGTDLWAVQAGRISVTPLQLDFTDEEARAKLATALGE